MSNYCISIPYNYFLRCMCTTVISFPLAILYQDKNFFFSVHRQVFRPKTKGSR